MKEKSANPMEMMAKKAIKEKVAEVLGSPEELPSLSVSAISILLAVPSVPLGRYHFCTKPLKRKVINNK